MARVTWKCEVSRKTAPPPGFSKSGVPTGFGLAGSMVAGPGSPLQGPGSARPTARTSGWPADVPTTELAWPGPRRTGVEVCRPESPRGAVRLPHTVPSASCLCVTQTFPCFPLHLLRVRGAQDPPVKSGDSPGAGDASILRCFGANP